MIPPSTSRPFGRPSPRLSEVDLAKIITRTIQMAVDAKRELGFAAVSTGCDGRQRTNFFDGSSCQTEGAEVCVAERQDGITACLQVQMQGSGIDFRAISFKPAPCSPATGWFFLDDAGYLYRVPADLLVAVPYWPPASMVSSRAYDIVRAGTWDKLMCSSPLGAVALRGGGHTSWVQVGLPSGEDTIFTQEYTASIGGHQVAPATNHFVTDPAIADSTNSVLLTDVSVSWNGDVLTLPATVKTFSRSSSTGALTPGTEYRALLYAYQPTPTTMSIGVRKGPTKAAGTSTTPSSLHPATELPLASILVPYVGPVVSRQIGGTCRPIGTTGSDTLLGQMTGILLRDYDYPSAGRRFLLLTLPAAESGVATGSVRIAYGYPLALQTFDEGTGPVSPFACTTLGETVTRIPYDMAFVYRPCLGIEYSPGHLCLGGPAIEQPGDCEILSSIDPISGGAMTRDVDANIIPLPNGEIGLVTPGGFPQRIERYRVRPAPTEAATFSASRRSLGPWGDDPNEWDSNWGTIVSTWTPGDTTFHRSVAWPHGRETRCVVWQFTSSQRHWSVDPTAMTGVLGRPAGLDCPVAFDSPGGAPALVPGATRLISLLGPNLVLTYGWTFKLNGVESALSPLPEPIVIQPTAAAPSFSLGVHVPLGPDGTTERSVYRFAYDQDVGYDGTTRVSPWDSRAVRIGACYDRMTRRVAVITDNVTTDIWDSDTVLTYEGDRPPSPFLGPIGGGIVVGGPPSVHLLQPFEL